MIIPRKGDIWEVIIPADKSNTGKRKRIVKEIGGISKEWYSREGKSDVRRPYCNWVRQSKGRYSGMRVKWLLKYGTRLSTKAERDAIFDALIAQRKAERALKGQ